MVDGGSKNKLYKICYENTFCALRTVVNSISMCFFFLLQWQFQFLHPFLHHDDLPGSGHCLATALPAICIISICNWGLVVWLSVGESWAIYARVIKTGPGLNPKPYIQYKY